MKNFAFIVTPININQLKNLWPAIRFIPPFLVKMFSIVLPRFIVLRLKPIKSSQEKETSGFLIVCPLLSRHTSLLSGEELVLDRIISAGHLAEKLGAKIVGLDCFAALVADKGYDVIVRNFKMPVTSGHALTAWSIFEGVYRIAKARNIELKNSSCLPRTR